MIYATEYAKRLAVWSDIQGHLPFLYEQACLSRKIIELGVRGGVSTSAFLAGIEKTNGHLWSVDIAKPKVPSWWMQSRFWNLSIGDDLSEKVARRQPAKVDLLFIDTSHFYEQTLNELRLYGPRAGVICCHDTELEYPEGYTGEPFPVARALDAYCAETGVAWQNHTGSYGLGVIQA